MPLSLFPSDISCRCNIRAQARRRSFAKSSRFLDSARRGPTPYELVEVKDRGAGVLRRSAVEGLTHVDGLVREPTSGNRDDRQDEVFLGIQSHNHLVSRDCDRVPGFDAALPLQEMQVPGNRVATFDIVTDLCRRYIKRLSSKRTFGRE